jgi:hypothetical protein
MSRPDLDRLATVAGNAYWNGLRKLDGKPVETKLFKVAPEMMPVFRDVVEAILREITT